MRGTRPWKCSHEHSHRPINRQRQSTDSTLLLRFRLETANQIVRQAASTSSPTIRRYSLGQHVEFLRSIDGGKMCTGRLRQCAIARRCLLRRALWISLVKEGPAGAEAQPGEKEFVPPPVAGCGQKRNYVTPVQFSGPRRPRLLLRWLQSSGQAPEFREASAGTLIGNQ
jgi:hypothetical protein